MTKERELLKTILATGWLNNTIYCREVEKLLAQPEPFKPDWDNYKQGVADSQREPFGPEERQRLSKAYSTRAEQVAFEEGIIFAEISHGIGVIPLYTTPPKREPLSDDEMRAIWKEGVRGEIPFVEIGRAIEKAHGIGGGE